MTAAEMAFRYTHKGDIWWSLKCQVTAQLQPVCQECLNHQRILEQRAKKKELNKYTRFDFIPHGQLVGALRDQRQENCQLKKKISSMAKKSNVVLPSDAHQELVKLMDAHQRSSSCNAFTKLFWDEQKRMFNCSTSSGKLNISPFSTWSLLQVQLFDIFTGHRWHPMMLKLAMLLHSQSPACYKTLRSTGILKLPGETTLREYSNFIHPEKGFNPMVIEEIRRKSEKIDKENWSLLLIESPICSSK